MKAFDTAGEVLQMTFLVTHGLLFLMGAGWAVYLGVPFFVRHWWVVPPLERVFLSQLAAEAVGGGVISMWRMVVNQLRKRYSDRERDLEVGSNGQADLATSDHRSEPPSV